MPLMNSVKIQSLYSSDNKLKKVDVNSLLEWVNHQPHLPKIDEIQAILFLQSCYYNNEIAKDTIDTYFTVKTICAEIFLNRNPLKLPLKETLNVSLYTPLDKKTPEGYTIIFVKLIDCNPDVYNFLCQLKYFDMSTISWMYENGPSEGHLMVVDMQGVTFGHMTKLGVLAIKKFLYYLQEAMPLRIKGLHYFNIVSFMDKILAMTKPFMKKELIDMLHLHKDVEDLIKFIPRECLPEDYGGQVDSTKVLHENCVRRINNNIDLFAFEDEQIVDESKRQGKAKNAGDYFGVEGTFKKLELD